MSPLHVGDTIPVVQFVIHCTRLHLGQSNNSQAADVRLSLPIGDAKATCLLQEVVDGKAVWPNASAADRGSTFIPCVHTQ